MPSPEQLRAQCGRTRMMAALAMLGAALLFAALPMPADAGPVKTVRCALPFTSGGANLLCTGSHQILYTTEGFTNNNSTITAELVAFDEQGNVLGSLPVHSGDLATLTSKVALDQLKLETKKNRHTMVAPIPILRVTADDGVDKVTAYCSNIPLARVFEPDGTVVAESEGDVTHVLAAIPQMDPAHLEVVVDGVDVFAGLGIGNPASCTAASPCGGNFNVGASVVTVSNLIVDVGPINVLARNTVSFDIAGLGCGGHLFSINGTPFPGARPKFLAASCHKDALADKGISSGFAITITSPTPGQSGVAVPAPVVGEVCSGRPIAKVNINGVDVPVGGQTHIPGNGTTTADTFKLAINTTLSETDLAQDFATGNAAFGADAGSNRLIVAATDDEGNRTFKGLLFGTRTTLNPGVSPSALEAAALHAVIGKFRDAIQDDIKKSALQALPSTVDVNNAFAIGLSPAAIQQQFDKRCTDPVNGVGKLFRDKVIANLLPNTPHLVKTTNVDPDCSCNVSVGVYITQVDINAANITCPVSFADGVIHATINLPSITIHVEAGSNGQGGDATCEDSVAGVCVARTRVRLTGTVPVTGINLKFDITEAQLLGTAPQGTPVFDKGTTGAMQNQDNHNSGIECIGGAICEFFSLVINAITFGATDLGGIDVSVDTDFSSQVGAAEPDPIGLKDIKIDEQKVADFNQTLSGTLSSVQIDVNGLVAGLKGTFATNVLDPEIAITPGALIQNPPLPTLPVAGASSAFVALSTDAINMLFAGMTLSGRLKESCQPSGNTLGDLLPADCETIVNAAGDVATALQQGICHGIRENDCDSLPGVGNLQFIKQGACHGTRGDNCATIKVKQGKPVKAAIERTTCQNTPNLNLKASQNILMCTRQDIPPRLAVLGGGGVNPVNTALRLKALSVALVLDRQGDGIDADLDTTPQCFSTGAPRLGDCSLYEACLDMNFKFDEEFVAPSPTGACGNVPGFKAVFKEVQVLNRQAGVICSGAGLAADDSLILSQSSTNDIITVTLPSKAEQFSPPLCMQGLDLGGFVTCGSQQLVAIETNGNNAFRDYLGVTCSITATP